MIIQAFCLGAEFQGVTVIVYFDAFLASLRGFVGYASFGESGLLRTEQGAAAAHRKAAAAIPSL
jgi:hypothetical protein